jgi:hypothetical protein
MRPPTQIHSSRAARGAALLLFCAFVLQMASMTLAQSPLRKATLKITTSTGVHTFAIEVAETDEQKQRGLMFRRSLPENGGMLFPYSPPQEITMWMKNTYISLDMVFITSNGVVLRVAESTEPFSEAIIASEGNAAAVLEVIAGTARRLRIKPGDKVEYALFAKK